MPAPNEMVWYKWFPVKALTSIRWQTLTLAQEGFYRRLYDWASLAQPSIKRGYLYEHNAPASVADITRMCRARDAFATQKFLDCMRAKGLMEQDEKGAWGFTNFAKHQRTANLRQRNDGLGSAETQPDSSDNRTKIGAIDADAEADAEAETEKNNGIASSAQAPQTHAPGVAVPNENGALPEPKPKNRRKKADKPVDDTPKLTGGKIWGLWMDVLKQERKVVPSRDGPDVAAAKRIAQCACDNDATLTDVDNCFFQYLNDNQEFLLKVGHGLRNLSGPLFVRYLAEGRAAHAEYLKQVAEERKRADAFYATPRGKEIGDREEREMEEQLKNEVDNPDLPPCAACGRHVTLRLKQATTGKGICSYACGRVLDEKDKLA